MGTRVLQSWTPQNTTSTIPALSNANSNNETRFSTYFIERGDYLKLRSAELGYSVPQRLTDKFRIENLRVFFIGTNLFTLFKKIRKRFIYRSGSLPAWQHLSSGNKRNIWIESITIIQKGNHEKYNCMAYCSNYGNSK